MDADNTVEVLDRLPDHLINKTKATLPEKPVFFMRNPLTGGWVVLHVMNRR